jgi:hypothetical protein
MNKVSHSSVSSSKLISVQLKEEIGKPPPTSMQVLEGRREGNLIVVQVRNECSAPKPVMLSGPDLACLGTWLSLIAPLDKASTFYSH